MVDPPLTVGLVHVTLRVPPDDVGTTDILSGTGATVCGQGIMLKLLSTYYYYTMKMTSCE